MLNFSLNLASCILYLSYPPHGDLPLQRKSMELPSCFANFATLRKLGDLFEGCVSQKITFLFPESFSSSPGKKDLFSWHIQNTQSKFNFQRISFGDRLSEAGYKQELQSVLCSLENLTSVVVLCAPKSNLAVFIISFSKA